MLGLSGRTLAAFHETLLAGRLNGLLEFFSQNRNLPAVTKFIF